MPPKKKGGKKGKKAKKEKADGGGAPGERPTSGKELTELSKERYQIQIKDLETRLQRYTAKCDDLELSNKDFLGKYDKEVKDKKDIEAFLKRELNQARDDIERRKIELETLQQEKDAEKQRYEKMLQQQRSKFQEREDELTSDNMILGGKLAALEEFKVQKDELYRKFEDMEKRLKEQADDHAETIYKLERKAVVDKDRLKKEMVLRVNTVAAEFRKVSNKQMADTTKRTIRENVSINSQLAKMSEKTKDLLQENDDFTERERKQKLQIDLLESTKDDITKKHQSNKKIIHMLTEKAREQEEILAEYEARDEEYQQLAIETVQLREENSELAARMDQLSGHLDGLQKDFNELREQKKCEVAAKERLEDILAATTISLTEVLQSEKDDEIQGTAKRQTMIERLSLVLNSAALLGKAPPPADLFKQRPKAIMAPLIPRSTKLPRGETLAGPTIHSFPHYKLGDLGLVPRPAPRPQSHPNQILSKGQKEKKFVELLGQPPKLPAIGQKNG